MREADVIRGVFIVLVLMTACSSRGSSTSDASGNAVAGKAALTKYACTGCHTDKNDAWATEALKSWASVSPWRAE